MSTEAMASVIKVLGSQTALSKVLGCTPQNVQRMCATGHVPVKHVLLIESASGISRTDIRPDIYPDHLPTLNANLRPNRAADQSAESAVQASSSGGAR